MFLSLASRLNSTLRARVRFVARALAIAMLACGAVNAATPAVDESINFFGYAGLNYSRPKDDSAGTTFDLSRWALGVRYRFDDRTRFVGEIEHGASAPGHSGEPEIEQAYIERELTPGIFEKAGLILIPSG